ncbi:coiled-coil domain-containing protein 160-like isoform X2 [Littorina saxatilis]|uniref:Uncharacterized protein n=1 Tax=Littorina saxatilis TaxID=31220 RepID=A0AAN9ANU2_9CAEN
MDSSKHHIPEEAKEKNEEKEKRPQGAGDWILELFSPTYANAAAVLDGKHEVTEEGPRIKMVSAFDPQSIKNVYERVHMMIKLEEELKKEKAQAGKEGSATKKRHTETTADSKRVNLQDSAIWNAEELSVLRGVFRAAKSQLSGLEVKLRQTQRHNAELEEKLASQGTLLDIKSKKLTEATKANHRLKIHCEELQLEVRSMVMKLEAVTEMWREIDQEKLRMMQENQEHRIALDKERMARQQLEIQLQEASQEIAREKMLAEENAKTRYEHHIHRLQEELVKAEYELEGERQLHSQNKRALEHLRNHFASLPLRDVLPPGVVDRDQVAFIDHVSL